MGGGCQVKSCRSSARRSQRPHRQFVWRTLLDSPQERKDNSWVLECFADIRMFIKES